VNADGAAPYLPERAESLSALAAAAAACRGCELYRDATQTVFGDGPIHAAVMLVGEQPGDVEDRRGEPFVGPAGGVLDRALAEAGLQRADVYLTNAVKHFRWKSTATGARRLHVKPGTAHVSACHPWLAAEIDAVAPSTLVALGATAAGALFGRHFRLTEQRGRELSWPPDDGAFADHPSPVHVAMATIHPSAVLRADTESRKRMYEGLVTDLKVATQSVGSAGRRLTQ
jgi:uracil-DNA glycosylase family protein